MTNRFSPGFTPDCTKKETIIGWIYLPIHIFVLPLLLTFLQPYLPEGFTDAQANAVYYITSLVVVLVVFWKMLRREFDHFLDRIFRCISGFLLGNALWYALAFLMTAMLMGFGLELSSPNDEMIDDMASKAYNITAAISIFMAPVLEEVLFRGVVFQSLRKKSRALAYIVSIALFSIYHVWQFAFVYQDPKYLFLAVQYIPITFAITWSYEYSGSLWTAIFFHMSNNFLALSVTQMT